MTFSDPSAERPAAKLRESLTRSNRNDTDARPDLAPTFHHGRDSSRSLVRARPGRTSTHDERASR